MKEIMNRAGWAACLTTLAIAAPAWAGESLDQTFGENGVSFPGVDGASIDGLAQDGEGRLVGVGGGFTVGRYQSNGSLDKSFGRGGSVTSFFGFDSLAHALAIQPDGKLVVAGTGTGFFDAAVLARYLPDGRLDRSFGKNGQARLSLGHRGGGALDVAVLPNGRILAAGFGIGEDDRWKAAVIAFRPNGTIDRRYNGDGLSTLTLEDGEGSIEFTVMQALRGGKLLLAGDIAGRVMLVRLLADGRPDPSFSGDGVAYVDVGGCRCRYASTTGLALDRRGRAVVSASLAGPDPEPAALLRFLPNGKLDRGFGKGGVVSVFLGTRVNSHDVVIEHNGRIVLSASYNVPGSGEARVAAMRYLPDGRLDRSFGRRGFFTRDFGVEGVAYAALVQHDGRVVIGGRVNPKPSPFHENESVFDTAEVFLARFLP
jgi:uncharacterized delta-60 repeat protein